MQCSNVADGALRGETAGNAITARTPAAAAATALNHTPGLLLLCHTQLNPRPHHRQARTPNHNHTEITESTAATETTRPTTRPSAPRRSDRHESARRQRDGTRTQPESHTALASWTGRKEGGEKKAQSFLYLHLTWLFLHRQTSE